MKSSIAESVTITPVLVADLHVEGERMPVYVHVIDHPDARVLVDTGMTVLHPLLADLDPASGPWASRTSTSPASTSSSHWFGGNPASDEIQPPGGRLGISIGLSVTRPIS